MNRPVKTSLSHPIRVDFVDTSNLMLSGRLGLSFAPGKKAPGMNGPWDRDLELDLVRLREHYGADGLVTLIEDHEFHSLHIEPLRERAIFHGLESHWLPIPDGGVPDDGEAFRGLVATVLGAVDAGQTVVVHCRGGLGRTGLLVACCLVALGETPDAAIARTRGARAGAIETSLQEAYIEAFECGWWCAGAPEA